MLWKEETHWFFWRRMTRLVMNVDSQAKQEVISLNINTNTSLDWQNTSRELDRRQLVSMMQFVLKTAQRTWALPLASLTARSAPAPPQWATLDHSIPTACQLQPPLKPCSKLYTRVINNSPNMFQTSEKASNPSWSWPLLHSSSVCFTSTFWNGLPSHFCTFLS